GRARRAVGSADGRNRGRDAGAQPESKAGRSARRGACAYAPGRRTGRSGGEIFACSSGRLKRTACALRPYHELMPTALNVDMHGHSTVTDGGWPPALVAVRAGDNGVDVWALTDHDESGGWAEAGAAEAGFGMRFATGVEISVTWAA